MAERILNVDQAVLLSKIRQCLDDYRLEGRTDVKARAILGVVLDHERMNSGEVHDG